MRITYYAEGSSWPYNTEAEALAEEAKIAAQRKTWIDNTAITQHDKLVHDLKECLHIPDYVIATCSHDCMRFKGMVRVCQDFVKQHEHNLKYY